jgi:beta-lactamase class D
MLKRICVLLLCLLPLAGSFAADPAWHEHPEWQAEFTDRGVAGTALIYDEHDDAFLVYDRARAETAFRPASTFKVFNALVALETGAVKDEYEVIHWDGVKRKFDGWNRDHCLASAMKFSAVWFYQEVARRAGQQRMQEWVDQVGYGNRDIDGGIDRFWLSGKLRISAVQQIDFLRRLAHGTLAFSERAQEAVRRITIVDAAPDYVMHGKTGWAPKDDAKRAVDLGWYVGWVERDGRRWFYALNIDMPNGGEDAAKRQLIAIALLTRAGALPAGK